VGVAEEAQADDIDPGRVLEVFLYATVFLGFVLMFAVGVAVVSALAALRQW
jgi:hypothetical protein